MSSIEIADSDERISRCLPVMQQLRPHLVEAAFVGKVRAQQKSGYVLAYLEDQGQVLAAAGFRMIENLVSDKLLYVDDLVTLEGQRSRGHGRAIFDWLVARARQDGCGYMELDSGVQRFAAHRFYLTHRMIISAHHFRLKL